MNPSDEKTMGGVIDILLIAVIFLIIVQLARSSMHRSDAIKNGCAEYIKGTGNFMWINKEKE